MPKHLEGMKRRHTLELARWIPNLGVGSIKVFQSFGTKVQWVNFVQTKSCLYHWKFLKMQISKLNLNFPFGTLNWESWPKGKARSQIDNNYDQFNTQPLKPKK